MKRFFTMAVVTLVGTGAMASVTDVRELPGALANLRATTERATELDILSRLGESQRAATVDLVARLADGQLTLSEVTEVLEKNAKGQQVFVNQLAISRDEPTDRSRLAGYALDRALERLGSDPGLQSDLLVRVAAEPR